ncbi:hypothetical protein EK904_001584 [Melospiza melodia maxima]|nr:hypothetical protein EK904_001584 [Melospiza melodia maxima]
MDANFHVNTFCPTLDHSDVKDEKAACELTVSSCCGGHRVGSLAKSCRRNLILHQAIPDCFSLSGDFKNTPFSSVICSKWPVPSLCERSMVTEVSACSYKKNSMSCCMGLNNSSSSKQYYYCLRPKVAIPALCALPWAAAPFMPFADRVIACSWRLSVTSDFPHMRSAFPGIVQLLICKQPSLPQHLFKFCNHHSICENLFLLKIVNLLHVHYIIYVPRSLAEEVVRDKTFAVLWLLHGGATITRLQSSRVIDSCDVPAAEPGSNIR